MHSVVVVALSTPIHVGVYDENNSLIETTISKEKSSEILATIFEKLLLKYEFKSIVYANGPGSFMAIKVSYIFLKTLSIVKNIPFFATDAFYFNKNRPIKAVGKLYFVKTLNKITTQPIDNVEPSVFELPKKINFDDFTTETLPFYGISAIGN
ncbi:MAG: hypothetical protein U9N42_11320 [Campylobacterota bacterium]|nr:hypothetical protein [Campylobacterota bacterium]